MSATSSPKITFNFPEAVSLPARTKLKAFIRSIFRNEGRRLETLNFIFCSDDYLLEINRQFLDHDYLTDIITFDLSDQFESTAEIYISVDRVRENAALFKIPFHRELLRVIFHGALHLSGYNDKKAKDQVLMRKKEDFYLERYFGK